MIRGLFETHIKVADLERAMDFYGRVLGLTLGRREDDRRVAFYWVGASGEAMLGLWEVPPPQVVSQHFAFRSSPAEMEHATAYLHARGLRGHNFLADGTERPMVFGWMPALALYFRDPDGHTLELLAMLPEPARAEVGVVSLPEWRRLSESGEAGPGANRPFTER
ncbi:VOC family protein [Deinococcus planocerae]|uniref:VOC family protein n=1 Tax=Deinococcus planocerae TaxID=1737569 RepID=UPI000C7F0CB9|nr:VOC family protein [Deinococcus planocerae]